MIAAFSLLPGSFINHNPFHQFPSVLHFPLKVSRLRTNTLATLVAYNDLPADLSYLHYQVEMAKGTKSQVSCCSLGSSQSFLCMKSSQQTKITYWLFFLEPSTVLKGTWNGFHLLPFTTFHRKVRSSANLAFLPSFCFALAQVLSVKCQKTIKSSLPDTLPFNMISTYYTFKCCPYESDQDS